MNEVMCLAYQNNIKIYNQDTDSMHMKYNDLFPLCMYFQQVYDRKLIGEGMGQFSTEFDVYDDVNDQYEVKFEPGSIIFVGMTSPARVVRSIEPKRKKGVSDNAVLHTLDYQDYKYVRRDKNFVNLWAIQDLTKLSVEKFASVTFTGVTYDGQTVHRYVQTNRTCPWYKRTDEILFSRIKKELRMSNMRFPNDHRFHQKHIDICNLKSKTSRDTDFYE
ncbi:hypothetical protein GEMRC1_000492 [Eukaryota sp. GEM-RC1]